MRVQRDERPRIRSTRTSSTANSFATSVYLFFQRSRPASAASSLGEFAIVRRGALIRDALAGDFFGIEFAVSDLARDGATRLPSPSILRKCGGHGASASPEASSLAASSSNFCNEPLAISI